jgi:hydroxypyruvate reductase
MTASRADLLTIYRSALAAVNGRRCVGDWLRRQPATRFRHVVAIGKAAAAMAAGAVDVLDGQLATVLVITREGYGDTRLNADSRVRQYESGHPLPDQRSLAAGRQLLDCLAAMASDEPVLFLVSGGASALVEVLPPPVSLTDLQRANAWLLASGLPIQAINAVRAALSTIKAGRLTAYLSDRPATVLLLSDVPGDDPAIIGSGLLYRPATVQPLPRLPAWLQALVQKATDSRPSAGSDTDIPHHVIASARTARLAACRRARALGYPVIEHEQLITGDVLDAAVTLVAMMGASRPGLHIWSGETTVTLPERPGQGGRCQSLALALALCMPRAEGDWYFLAAGSDGSDGPGQIAGALVDSDTCSRIRAAGHDPQQCLSAADAGTCLQATDDVVVTGPTGTNVMDIMLGLRHQVSAK